MSLQVDTNRLRKEIVSQITRGIAGGLSYTEIAQNIQQSAEVPFHRARTITITEGGRVQEQANFDAATEAKKQGADVVKQWSSVRDSSTRDTHRLLDGQVRELDEPFTVEGKEAMHPHGFGLPEEDINCRCTMLTRARAVLDDSDLQKMQERAEKHGLYYLTEARRGDFLKKKDLSFAEFKRKYLKADDTLKKQNQAGIIKTDKVISGHASTPKKAEPNTVIDHVEDDGTVDIRSFYGENGYKHMDINTTSHGNPKYHHYGRNGEHAHDYIWNEDGSVKEKTTRELTDEERKENSDIL